MKTHKPEAGLVYCPRLVRGQSEFRGIPRPTKEVIELIGNSGIDFIVEKFRQLILDRKEMYGTGFIGFYGLDKIQRFFDLETRTSIKAKEYIRDIDIQSRYKRSDPLPRNFRLSVEKLSNSSIYSSYLDPEVSEKEAKEAIKSSYFQDVRPDYN